jgi:hypothetical protein
LKVAKTKFINQGVIVSFLANILMYLVAEAFKISFGDRNLIFIPP